MGEELAMATLDRIRAGVEHGMTEQDAGTAAPYEEPLRHGQH
jgi:hypothetical protein